MEYDDMRLPKSEHEEESTNDGKTPEQRLGEMLDKAIQQNRFVRRKDT